jgi:hypothetical protein
MYVFSSTEAAAKPLAQSRSLLRAIKPLCHWIFSTVRSSIATSKLWISSIPPKAASSVGTAKAIVPYLSSGIASCQCFYTEIFDRTHDF